MARDFSGIGKFIAARRRAELERDVAEATWREPEAQQTAIPPQNVAGAGDAYMPGYSTEAAQAGATDVPLKTQRDFTQAKIAFLNHPTVKKMPNAIQYVEEQFKRKQDETQFKYLNQAEQYADFGDWRNAGRMMDVAYSYLPNGFTGKFAPNEKGDGLKVQIYDENSGQLVDTKDVKLKDITKMKDRIQLAGKPETRAEISLLEQQTATSGEQGKMYRAHAGLYGEQAATEPYKRGKLSAQRLEALAKAEESQYKSLLNQGKIQELNLKIEDDVNKQIDYYAANLEEDNDVAKLFVGENAITTRKDLNDIVKYAARTGDAIPVATAVELLKMKATGKDLNLDPGEYTNAKGEKKYAPTVEVNGRPIRISGTFYNNIYKAIKEQEAKKAVAAAGEQAREKIKGEEAAKAAKKKAAATEWTKKHPKAQAIPEAIY